MRILPEPRSQQSTVPDVRPQLARIRIGFLVRLEERCLDMDRLANAIDANGVQPHLIDALSEHVHKISGVAATLGFARLGALAAKTDGLMTELKLQKDWIAMRDLVEALLNEVETVLETQTPDGSSFEQTT